MKKSSKLTNNKIKSFSKDIEEYKKYMNLE